MINPIITTFHIEKVSEVKLFPLGLELFEAAYFPYDKITGIVFTGELGVINISMFGKEIEILSEDETVLADVYKQIVKRISNP